VRRAVPETARLHHRGPRRQRPGDAPQLASGGGGQCEEGRCEGTRGGKGRGSGFMSGVSGCGEGARHRNVGVARPGGFEGAGDVRGRAD
jgi:hypothetical protein